MEISRFVEEKVKKDEKSQLKEFLLKYNLRDGYIK